MPEPTIGDSAIYTPAPGELVGKQCAATVAATKPDGTVTLAVFDGNGKLHSRADVRLIGAEDDLPGAGPYAQLNCCDEVGDESNDDGNGASYQ